MTYSFWCYFQWNCFPNLIFRLYRNTVGFCLLILYPATLLNYFLSSNTFLVESLEFLLTRSCLLQIGIVLLLSFQSGCLLFHLLALARISSTVLNRSGERAHLCLVPDPRGKAFSMMLAVGFLQMLFIRVKKSPYTSSLSNVSITEHWILSNAFSASIKEIMWFWSFILLIWCITLIDFQKLSDILSAPWIVWS